MLFKQDVLRGIAEGRISCAFRRWRRASVRSGTTMRTAVGLLRVTSIDAVTPDEVTDADARRAGFADAGQVLERLGGRPGDPIYRIGLEHAGTDPRVDLREQADLGPGDLDQLVRALERLDHRSRRGPWTARILGLIAERPDTPATELAADLGVERDWFKRNVRKLKELGLTESRSPGYRLSPRGEAFRRHVTG